MSAWYVELTGPARQDFSDILLWTQARFGLRQARAYAVTLREALKDLRSGADTLGVRRRDDLPDDVLLLHVSRRRRRGRHFIVFRPRNHNLRGTIQVLRILHDGMDLVRHLRPPGEDE